MENISMIKKINFVLIIISIISCIYISDFNILIGFILHFLMVRKYNKDKKLYLKIFIHIIVIFTFFELIFIIINSIQIFNKVILFITVIELILKLIIGYLCYNEFIKKFNNDLNYLYKIEYQYNKYILNENNNNLI